MGELEQLKKMQKIALEVGDFASLNAINQKIFELREKLRKERKKEKQQQVDQIIHEKIEEIITK